jgi:TetR/AcrR family transcriptional repressor of lmrAB and yxaGH operons
MSKRPREARKQARKPPRERMVESAAVLIRERGVEATSFSDVIVASGAPRGSIYYYFPRGKAQLIEEATKFGTDFVLARLAASLERGNIRAAIRRFGEFYAQILRDSGFSAGCPVLAAALEGERTPGAREIAGRGFQQWEELIAVGLKREGIKPAQAKQMATLIVSSLEGGVVLSRARRTTEPLERVLDQIEQLIRSTKPAPAARKRKAA